MRKLFSHTFAQKPGPPRTTIDRQRAVTLTARCHQRADRWSEALIDGSLDGTCRRVALRWHCAISHNVHRRRSVQTKHTTDRSDVSPIARRLVPCMYVYNPSACLSRRPVRPARGACFCRAKAVFAYFCAETWPVTDHNRPTESGDAHCAMSPACG